MNRETVPDLRSEARAWIAANWRPELTLRAWWGRLAEAGFAFPGWPAGLGGRGLGRREAAVVARELAAAGALGPPGGVGQMIGGPVLAEFGTAAQQRRWLPSLAAGLESWCQLFSEPEAGSDLAALRLRATRDGDRWLLNGQKLWSREAEGADRGLVLARTDPSVPKRRGISYFVVDLDQPGVEVRPIRQMNGKATFNEVFLTDVVVPDGRLIGALGQGWPIAQASLVLERVEVGGGSIGRPARGVAPGPRNGMLDRPVGELMSASRPEPGARTARRTPAEMIGLAAELGGTTDPAVRARIARMHALAETNRRASRARRGPAASLGKLAGSALGRDAGEISRSLLGTRGLLAGPDAHADGAYTQLVLSVPSLSIAGGTDEIQRTLIAERVLGLPREPDVERDRPFHDPQQGGSA